jgi:hypothetical protein
MTLTSPKRIKAAEILFFEDFPFLDDPDNSDEQVMHGVEQRTVLSSGRAQD